MDDAEGARQALLSSERQRRMERHETDLSRTKLEMEVASLKSELASKATDMLRMERERQVMRDGWEREAVARILAEVSTNFLHTNANRSTSLYTSSCQLMPLGWIHSTLPNLMFPITSLISHILTLSTPPPPPTYPPPTPHRSLRRRLSLPH